MKRPALVFAGPHARVVLAVAVAGLLYTAYALVSPRVRASAASPQPPTIARIDAGAILDAPAPRIEAAPTPTAPPRLPDGSPQRILLFGDSMVPVLAPRLADWALESGHALFPVVWYGSTIIRWAKVDELDQLLVELQPTIVVAVLGSSELTVRDVLECEPFVQILAQKVGKRKLVWVGPPNWRDDTGVNAMIERAVGAGRFFRSSALSLDRRADGIHPSDRGGADWADAFARWVRDESSAPIVLARPTRTAPPLPARLVSRRH
jgi:hypothetical protein